MGAVAKHMQHPYDNLNLTFGELKIIMSRFAAGTMECLEKWDGTNMHWYIAEDGEPRFARNFTDIRENGVTIKEMKKRLKSHPAKEQFLRGMEAIYSTREKVNWTLRQDGTYWINCEIIDTKKPQCIKYDKNCIIWHKLVTPNEKKNGTIDVVGTQMTAFVEMLMNCMRHGEFDGWSVYGPMHLFMGDKHADPTVRRAFTELNSVLETLGFDLSNTIEDIVIKRTKEQGLKAGLPEDQLDRLCQLVLSKKPAPRIQTMRNLSSSPELITSMALHKNRVHWKNRCLAPIVNIWQHFSAQILEGVSSNLIEDSEKATNRLNRLIEWNVAEAQERVVSHPGIWADCATNLMRFESLSVEPPIIEGAVFVWKGNTYKMTGAFPSLNRVCGSVRYPLGIQFPEGEEECKLD